MKLNLYWVTTEDHHEDWFMVAATAKGAAKLHEDQEGYLRGDARAEKILTIPSTLDAEPGWPEEELLLALGAEFISRDETRVVVIGGRTFCEGLLESLVMERADDMAEMIGQGRPNNTTKRKTH